MRPPFAHPDSVGRPWDVEFLGLFDGVHMRSPARDGGVFLRAMRAAAGNSDVQPFFLPSRRPKIMPHSPRVFARSRRGYNWSAPRPLSAIELAETYPGKTSRLPYLS